MKQSKEDKEEGKPPGLGELYGSLLRQRITDIQSLVENQLNPNARIVKISVVANGVGYPTQGA